MPTEPTENTQTADQQPPQGETPVADFETWLNEQSDDVKGLYSTHVTGLKSALNSERTQNKDFAKQLRDLTKQAEEGSALRTELEKLTAAQEEADSRASFYEDASRAGCTNLKLAWLAAKEADLLDRYGRVNLETLKQQAPELFRSSVPTPRGNAGNGAGQAGTAQKDMNAFIRKAAGRN